ncbi:MAG: hypothetical protein IPM34_06540 [Saprospiraceae bacterium]|nr:hypothetical protein [Saprospiraceae bacterium]
MFNLAAQLQELPKRFIGIGLLICLVVPGTAVYVLLQHQKHIIRKEVKRNLIAGINKNELILLKFSSSEKSRLLTWEHSREFEYQHNMYDVVEESTVNDTTSYWCWWDHEETKLNKQLVDLCGGAFDQHPQTNDCQEKIFSFYKSLFNNPVDIHHAALQLIIVHTHRLYHSSLEAGFEDLFAVPPEQS